MRVRRDIFAGDALERQECEMLRLNAIEQYQLMLGHVDADTVREIYLETERSVLDAFNGLSENADFWSLSDRFGRLFNVQDKDRVFRLMKNFLTAKANAYEFPDEFVYEILDSRSAENVVQWAKHLVLFQITLPVRRGREFRVQEWLRRFR